MVKDAEAHEAEDRARREEAEVRNNADTLVYRTEQLIKEQGENLSGPEKEAVENSLAELKTAIAGDDVSKIKAATEALMSASQSFTTKLYEEAAKSATSADMGSSSGSTASSDDEIVDAEIVDEPNKES
jgi:molecular chaperone DnaK